MFHANWSTQETENHKRKRFLGYARDDDTRAPLPSSSFSSHCGSQPQTLRGTSFTGRRENAAHRSLPHMGRMTIRETAFLIFFTPLRKPTSAPSGHLLPTEGERIAIHRLPMQKAFHTRTPLSPIVISSECEKSFSFAVRQGCAGSGERETPCSLRLDIMFHPN